MKGKSKSLTWDELADIYKKDTGRFAKIRPMDYIFQWAEDQPDKFYVDPKEGTLHLIKSEEASHGI